MFCTKCGREVKDDMRFCDKCGAAIIIYDIDQTCYSAPLDSDSGNVTKSCIKDRNRSVICGAIIATLITVVICIVIVIRKHTSDHSLSSVVEMEETEDATIESGDVDKDTISEKIIIQQDDSDDDERSDENISNEMGWDLCLKNFLDEEAYLRDNWVDSEPLSETEDYVPITYALYDFEKDGVPEVLVNNGGETYAENYEFLYGYDTGSYKYIGILPGEDTILKYGNDSDYGGLFAFGSLRGEHWKDYYDLSEGKLCKTVIFFGIDDVSNDSDNGVQEIEKTSDNALRMAFENANTNLEYVDKGDYLRMEWESFLNKYGFNSSFDVKNGMVDNSLSISEESILNKINSSEDRINELTQIAYVVELSNAYMREGEHVIGKQSFSRDQMVGFVKYDLSKTVYWVGILKNESEWTDVLVDDFYVQVSEIDVEKTNDMLQNLLGMSISKSDFENGPNTAGLGVVNYENKPVKYAGEVGWGDWAEYVSAKEYDKYVELKFNLVSYEEVFGEVILRIAEVDNDYGYTINGCEYEIFERPEVY